MKTIISKYKISEETYLNTLFELGMRYIERQCENYPEIAKVFSRSPIFWNWYKKQYKIIDEYCLSINANWDEYKNLHDDIDNFPSPAIQKLIHNGYHDTAMAIIDKDLEDNF